MLFYIKINTIFLINLTLFLCSIRIVLYFIVQLCAHSNHCIFMKTYL